MIDNVVTWAMTGSNLFFTVVLFLVLWIFYEYAIDFVLRLPRVFVIIGAMYFILKTFFGLPL
jgi:hypothetical protein